MIYNTPELSEEMIKSLSTQNYRDWPLMKRYPGYDECFVAFHPFLKIKNGHEEYIKFESYSRPNKFEIQKHCEPLSWLEIINLTGIIDIKSLDRALAFLHRAYSFGERTEYYKLIKLLVKDRLDILPAEVDDLPLIIKNKILHKLRSLDYDSVLIYSDFNEHKELINIDKLIENPIGLPTHVRIETPDEKILIVQDFDQRFAYFFSNKSTLYDIIESTNLEGFFCNEHTPESWSYYPILEPEKIDWSEDMKNSYENNFYP
ncbi:MAG: DUF2711 family protein [Saprospiraceae bacterium]|nr:DUF2711 family protein [Saprospiraceae bacterium]HRG33961.1 DUF2711 family protein [Saprospiraceae bacterium]